MTYFQLILKLFLFFCGISSYQSFSILLLSLLAFFLLCCGLMFLLPGTTGSEWAERKESLSSTLLRKSLFKIKPFAAGEVGIKERSNTMEIFAD